MGQGAAIGRRGGSGWPGSVPARACPRRPDERGEFVHSVVEDCVDDSSLSALLESSSKSACTFPCTSMIASALASFFFSRSFSARNRASSVRDGAPRPPSDDPRHHQRAFAVLAAPVGDDRRVQALAAQQRAFLARLAAPVVVGQDGQLVVVAEQAALGPLTARALRGPQRLAAPPSRASLPGPHRAHRRRVQCVHDGDPPPPPHSDRGCRRCLTRCRHGGAPGERPPTTSVASGTSDPDRDEPGDGGQPCRRPMSPSPTSPLLLIGRPGLPSSSVRHAAADGQRLGRGRRQDPRPSRLRRAGHDKRWLRQLAGPHDGGVTRDEAIALGAELAAAAPLPCQRRPRTRLGHGAGSVAETVTRRRVRTRRLLDRG